ncbi:os [Drosophila busckii]|uniref:Os n=1 Tax=Drosophila busckii TaxID=30019 RepID=A0A0M4EJZ2_DROBS|nr:os [Drosophila busckii]
MSSLSTTTTTATSTRKSSSTSATSTLLLLLLLQFAQLQAALAMSTAHGGLTVIEAASTTSSSSSITTTSSSSTNSQQQHFSSSSNSFPNSQRKRHRKRNSSWYDDRNYNENTTTPEWLNPCGGSYYQAAANERRRPLRPKQVFNQLKRAAGTEYRELSNSHEQQFIDIRDMQMWSLHNYNYKFLPKLKPNSTIALKRWYRNMQTYVASFAYLRRVQLNWDHQYLERESPVAKELRNLLLSSRSMLCELETALLPRDSKTERRQRRQRNLRRQRLQQQQQQQQLLSSNRKEFNEVSKPSQVELSARRGKRQQPASASAAAQRHSRRVLRT